jgi:rubrerythrin
MQESKRQILEILKKALEAERSFQKEYARGASLAEDPEVREVFLKLVNDEMEHERILLERYRLLQGEPPINVIEEE